MLGDGGCESNGGGMAVLAIVAGPRSPEFVPDRRCRLRVGLLASLVAHQLVPRVPAVEAGLAGSIHHSHLPGKLSSPPHLPPHCLPCCRGCCRRCCRRCRCGRRCGRVLPRPAVRSLASADRGRASGEGSAVPSRAARGRRLALPWAGGPRCCRDRGRGRRCGQRWRWSAAAVAVSVLTRPRLSLAPWRETN